MYNAMQQVKVSTCISHVTLLCMCVCVCVYLLCVSAKILFIYVCAALLVARFDAEDLADERSTLVAQYKTARNKCQRNRDFLQ